MSLKGPPQEAWKIITKLHEQQGVFSKFFGKSDPRLEEIDQLKEYLCPGIVQHISFLIFDSNVDIAQKAADFINLVLDQTSNNELMQLDELIRGHYEYQYSSLWGYEPKDINSILKLNNHEQLIGLCSFFPNGYLREAALKELIKIKNENVLKFILLRLNDWVAPIRIIAKTEIIERLTSDSSKHFINLLDIVERMYLWGRDQHGDIIKQIEHQVTRPENEALVVEAFKNPNFRIRRFLVKVLSQSEHIIFNKTVDLVKEDKDLMVRFIFLRSIKESLTVDQAQIVVQEFQNDKLAGIKRLCVEIAVDNKLANTKELLEHLLFDNSKSVRELSRWYLEKEYGVNDFRSVYRTEIEKENYSFGCICGLGEVGEKSDTEIVIKLISHQRVKVRRAAFLALSKLDPELVYDHVLKNISTESPSMIKCMAQFISDNFSHYSKDTIWKLMLDTDVEIVKTNLLIAIISKSTKWQKLVYMLRAAEKVNEPQIRLIYSFLRKWLYNFNRSFNQPSSAELSDINNLMEKSILEKDILRSVAAFIPKN